MFGVIITIVIIAAIGKAIYPILKNIARECSPKYRKQQKIYNEKEKQHKEYMEKCKRQQQQLYAELKRYEKEDVISKSNARLAQIKK